MIFAHPLSTTIPENNSPVYAKMSKCSSILFLSVKRSTVGTWRIFLQPASSKWSSNLFRYRSDGRSPFLPKSCLFWLSATAKATTAIKNHTGLSLSFDSPVVLIFTPITNLLLYRQAVWATGRSTRNILKGPSSIHVPSQNRCYRLQPLLIALSQVTRGQDLLICILFWFFRLASRYMRI